MCYNLFDGSGSVIRKSRWKGVENEKLTHILTDELQSGPAFDAEIRSYSGQDDAGGGKLCAVRYCIFADK